MAKFSLLLLEHQNNGSFNKSILFLQVHMGTSTSVSKGIYFGQ